MQVTTITSTQPVPPGTPVGATAPGVTIQGTSITAGVPTSTAEVEALRAKRSELSNQLESAASRRQRLSGQLTGKEGADRAGIEARIGVLDKRIMQLESDIAETGRQLTMAPGMLVESSGPASQFGGIDPDLVGAMGGAFIVFVLSPLAVAAAWRMWKKATRGAPPQISGDAIRRMERLEQGMDAIAIEVERVSEGQRFITRILSEAHSAPSIGAGQRIAEAVAVGGGERGRQAGA